MFSKIEIMDTTLRDGEQTEGVSFTSFEKLQLSRFFLEQLCVDRIEIASARVSMGEHKTVTEIFEWANQRGYSSRIEVLGFVDGKRSVDWIKSAGGRNLNLLTKGSKHHCEVQLNKTLSEHLKDIQGTLQYAFDENLKVNTYLEDWSNGFLHSPLYVEELIKELLQMKISRFLLPDTLGIFAPNEVKQAIDSILQRHPECAEKIDFHGHNDYGLAVANCLAAVEAGVGGLHVSMNGLGERAGNSPLEAVVTALHDKLNVKTNVNELAITDASRLVEIFSGKRIQSNRPIVGQDVYTQTSGVHADGDKKANLYANPILPERFGRKRLYALGKLSGKASISQNLTNLGLVLSSEEEHLLLDKIKELAEKKKNITPDDLPFLIEDLFGYGFKQSFKVIKAELSSHLDSKAKADITISLDEKEYHAISQGDGGYDAFMNALGEIMQKLDIQLPHLLDYEVRIPPGGKTDALVEALITWEDTSSTLEDLEKPLSHRGNTNLKKNFRTVGVATDQVIAAIRATEKMLNLLLFNQRK